MQSFVINAIDTPNDLLYVYDYLKRYYYTDNVYGTGLRLEDKIIVYTKDFVRARNKYLPTRYDLHVFKNGKGKTKRLICVTHAKMAERSIL